jgi:hypothetical protein
MLKGGQILHVIQLWCRDENQWQQACKASEIYRTVSILDTCPSQERKSKASLLTVDNLLNGPGTCETMGYPRHQETNKRYLPGVCPPYSLLIGPFVKIFWNIGLS